MVSTRPARRSAQPACGDESWLSQHVSASERLSRNHPTPEQQTRPQHPGHPQEVSTRPTRRARRSAQPACGDESWLSQHVSASERLSRNHPTPEQQTRPQHPGHPQEVSTRPTRRARRSAQPACGDESWLSQHVSASERLSRNHPTPGSQNPTQDPGHPQEVSTRPTRRSSQVGSTSFGKKQAGSTSFEKDKAGSADLGIRCGACIDSWCVPRQWASWISSDG